MFFPFKKKGSILYGAFFSSFSSLTLSVHSLTQEHYYLKFYSKNKFSVSNIYILYIYIYIYICVHDIYEYIKMQVSEMA